MYLPAAYILGQIDLRRLSGASKVSGMTQVPEVTLSDVIPRKAHFPELTLLLKLIEETYAPKAVLLFGSRARGDSRSGSDWDLLVLLKDEAPKKLLDPYLRWQTKLGIGISADILASYESEFLGLRDVATTLAYEIRNDAVQLV
jgi:predicted nucleotidyltransferase